ncbi:hypothetical protein [Psychroserpens sp. S379A]|uniref:hypothetical protein n=1 Tax=Psychroserpens sp. S379A TaxID=3415137 RepID=UPI003C7CECEF
MSKNLFFLCPTDCLESVINNAFKNENYFYTSLGNSVTSDIKTVEHIKKLIIKYNIDNLYFVLSDHNQIILDALGRQLFLDTRGLNDTYKQLVIQKQYTDELWRKENHQFVVLSYFLNKKVKAFQDVLNIDVTISGKIFKKRENMFRNIYSDLICLERHALN